MSTIYHRHPESYIGRSPQHTVDMLHGTTFIRSDLFRRIVIAHKGKADRNPFYLEDKRGLTMF